MNNLSWLLYWADAAPSLSRWLAIVAFIGFVITAFISFLGLTGFCGDEAGGDRTAINLAPRFRKFWPLTVLFFVLWGGSFLVPSKDTFYMIAASEAGEQAIQTPEFTKVRGVLNKWLDDQIKSDEAPTKEESK